MLQIAGRPTQRRSASSTSCGSRRKSGPRLSARGAPERSLAVGDVHVRALCDLAARWQRIVPSRLRILRLVGTPTARQAGRTHERFRGPPRPRSETHHPISASGSRSRGPARRAVGPAAAANTTAPWGPVAPIRRLRIAASGDMPVGGPGARETGDYGGAPRRSGLVVGEGQGTPGQPGP